MAINTRTQLALDEEMIEDPALLLALDEWQEAREDAEPYTQRAREQDKVVKGLVADKGLEPGVYRIGAFRITIREVEAKHIEFDVKDAKQTRIRFLADD